jgi:hypothetical protein
MKFDGKDYEEKGPNSSGKPLNARTLELTSKVKGDVMEHDTYDWSLKIRNPVSTAFLKTSFVLVELWKYQPVLAYLASTRTKPLVSKCLLSNS